MMPIRYVTSVDGIAPSALQGFFRGWRKPLSPDVHLRILRNSAYVALALADERVVGFVNALTDGTHAAFISLLEVLPEYHRRGIGTELMRRILHELRAYACIDLTCDPDLQPFYERCGMRRSVGMIVRNYD